MENERERGRSVDWWRTSEMVEVEIGRKRDWGTMAERKRERAKDVFEREKEK